MKSLGVIPARLHSTRLVKKPLQMIEGKSLLAHTIDNLEKCEAIDEVLVLTDSQEIVDHVESLGQRALLSPSWCTSGLERIAVMHEKLSGFDRIVNIQCDEPNISMASIEKLTQMQGPVATLCCKIDAEAAAHPANVKVVFDRKGKALYFSRAPIPFYRDKTPDTYYKHIGLYSYAPEFLKEYLSLEKGRYEEIEQLEQLTLLENGIPIKVAIVDDLPFGIDTPQDIQEFTAWLKRQNTSSSQAVSSPH